MNIAKQSSTKRSAMILMSFSSQLNSQAIRAGAISLDSFSKKFLVAQNQHTSGSHVTRSHYIEHIMNKVAEHEEPPYALIGRSRYDAFGYRPVIATFDTQVILIAWDQKIHAGTCNGCSRFFITDTLHWCL